jgi:hypothetical protein
MTRRETIHHPLKLKTQIKTVLQHKIRAVMKCYTLREFTADEETKTFTFKKSHIINKIRMDDPKTYTGSYLIEEIDEENSKLIIMV